MITSAQHGVEHPPKASWCVTQVAHFTICHILPEEATALFAERGRWCHATVVDCSWTGGAVAAHLPSAHRPCANAEALVRLLHLNAPPSALKGSSGDDEAYKVLVLDRITKDIVAPLLRINDLRKCAPVYPACPCVQALLVFWACCAEPWHALPTRLSCSGVCKQQPPSFLSR